jgi:hypothetical protein
MRRLPGPVRAGRQHESIALCAASQREGTRDRQFTRKQNRMLEGDPRIRHQDAEKLEGI